MERMELLEKLKQQKPKLICNPGSHCWCDQVSFRLDVPNEGKCLSPGQLLLVVGDELTPSDYTYLETLLGREIVQHGE